MSPGGKAADATRPLVALLTPRGRGAVATIRMRADVRRSTLADSLPFRAANGRPLGVQPPGRVVFGRWGGDPAEEVVVCLLDEQTLEIHCHGGEAAAARILHDCAQAGCRMAEWQELAQLAAGCLEAELAERLAAATTLRTAALLLEQASGLLRGALESLAAEGDCELRTRRIKDLLRWADFGLHLTEPWRVVLAGRPNAGKSSLVNALLGYTRSIVFDRPGTTRDVVTATTAVDGWPIEFSDTAGLRTSAEPLEAAGIARARGALAEADLALVLVDVSRPATIDDRALLADLPEAIVVAHKCDLPQWDPSEWNGSGDWNGPGEGNGPGDWVDRIARGGVRVSSKTGEGVDALLRTISERLVPEAPAAGTPIPVTARQVSLLRRADLAAERGEFSACRQILCETLR